MHHQNASPAVATTGRVAFLPKCYQSGPPWLTLLLLLPLLYLVAIVAKDPCLAIITGHLPAYVLAGKLFTEPFNIIHAGCAMDQPTIGKWLLWFSVLTMLSLPVILLARWLGNRRKRIGYWLFALPTLGIVIQLLCVLLLLLCMLVQYVYWMGFTPRRVLGLGFGVAAFILLPWFLRWALRRPMSPPASP